MRAISDEPVSEVLRRVGHQDFAAVLYVLVELSVLGRSSGERRTARGRSEKRLTLPDRLDQAVRLGRRAL